MNIPEDAKRKWTIEAILCYLNHCKCKKCYLTEFCETLNSNTCKMKYVVIELVRKYGKPKTELIHNALEKMIE